MKLINKILCFFFGHKWGAVYNEMVDAPCSTPQAMPYHDCNRCGKKEICKDCLAK